MSTQTIKELAENLDESNKKIVMKRIRNAERFLQSNERGAARYELERAAEVICEFKETQS